MQAERQGKRGKSSNREIETKKEVHAESAKKNYIRQFTTLVKECKYSLLPYFKKDNGICVSMCHLIFAHLWQTEGDGPQVNTGMRLQGEHKLMAHCCYSHVSA